MTTSPADSWRVATTRPATGAISAAINNVPMVGTATSRNVTSYSVPTPGTVPGATRSGGPTATTCASVTSSAPAFGCATITSVGAERTPAACANTCAEPMVSATSRPAASTDTLSGALEVQVTLPNDGAPCESSSCADNCADCPLPGNNTDGLSITTLPTAAATTTVRLAGLLVTPPLLAVMLAVPAATPVAMPSLTVATPPFDEAQVKLTPVITAPCWSVASAFTLCVCPTAMLALAGVTLMDATVGADGPGAGESSPPPQPDISTTSDKAPAHSAARPSLRKPEL